MTDTRTRAAKTRTKAARRLPVPLTQQDEVELAESKTLIQRMLNLGDSPSDAALVHAVFDLGMQQVREARRDAAYEALAATYNDDAARRVARRRRPLSADDE